MLTPDGHSADKTDKIMLLAMWAKTLSSERANSSQFAPMISAGMGKPTFAINQYTVQMQLAYWKHIEERVIAAKINSLGRSEDAAIGYGDPHGEARAREVMASAMSRWYEADISPENILFTVGGAGALRVIFETFNLLYKDMPKYRVITPFPYYTLYADNRHILHPIDVMKEPGYRLTAQRVQASIEVANKLAEKDGGYPKVLLLCNPNNPLGTVIEEEELIKISELLRANQDLHIVLDEAYAEMCLDIKKVPALLTLAPDLKCRVIIMRSATKALSAAGERMAMLMAFDEGLMAKFLDKNISTIGHAPQSAQIAYAETMAHFTDEDQQKLVTFYRNKVLYVSERLKEMGASMPDAAYKASATFYALADLSDLMGLDLPEESARALGKTGKVKTSEDITYYLLFKDSVMIAPLLYYGLPKKLGFMRFTCSGSEEELCNLMDRIEARLFEARHLKKVALMDEITQKLSTLKQMNSTQHDEIMSKIIAQLSIEETCLGLKDKNHALKTLDSRINILINQSTEHGKIKAATTIQSYFRRHLAQKEKIHLSDYSDEKWRLFVDTIVPEASTIKSYFLSLAITDRLKLVPWKEYLKTTNTLNHNALR